MNQEFITDLAQYDAALTQIAELSALVKPWTEYKEKLVQYMLAKYFGAYGPGKHTISLPDGRTVEIVKGENISINEDLLPIVFDQMIGAANRPEGVPYTVEQGKALQQLHKLVRWTPVLDKRQYDKLPEDAQDIFEQALTRSSSKPTFTVK